ncbi:MAG: GAF domain-containing protein [Byssovorax cruenta]
MPKKKPIAKRLNSLFKDLTPEQATTESKVASTKRAPSHVPPQSEEIAPITRSRSTIHSASPLAAPSSSAMSLAFQMGQDNWATLQVMDENNQRKWSQDDQLLVKQVADQLSLALENAQLFQETQSRAEELAVLNEMGNELSTKLDPKSVAEVVYKYTSRLMDTGFFFVALYDEKKMEKMYPVAFEDGRRIDLPRMKVTGSGFTDYIIQHKKAVFAPVDVLGHMKLLGINFVPLDEDETPSQCWLGVPMLIGDRVLGVISVQSVVTPRLYDEHDRDLLTTIASQAAIAVENARLFDEAQRRARETAALAEVGREISSTLDLTQVLERIASYAKELLRAETCAVYLPDKQHQRWPAIAVAGLDVAAIKGDPLTEGHGILGSIINTKEGRIANDASDAPDVITIAGTVKGDFEHLMGTPIMVKENITGLMGIWRSGAGKEFVPAELDFLTSLARQAAVAIENARLYTQEQYRRQIADALSDMARIAGSSLNISDVVQRLLEQLPRLVPFRTASVQLIEPNGQRRQVGGLSLDKDRMRTLESPAEFFIRTIEDDKLIYEIVKLQDAVILSDTHQDPRWDVRPETADIRSWLGAPLVAGKDVIGILILDDNTPNAFSEDALELIRAFTPQAAIAIQNARLFEDISTSQGQLSEALRIARIGYFEIDLQGQTIKITDELFSLLNTTAEGEGGYELPLQQTLNKFVVKDDIPLATQALREAIASVGGNENITSEIRFRTTDGKELWVSTIYRVIRDAKGNPAQVAGSSQDITDRKTNELTQAAISHISESALTSHTIEELSKAVHDALNTLLPAKNFYLALYDAASRMITFPYHVDEVDEEWSPRKLGKGLTSYVIRTGKVLRATPEILAELEASGEVINDGERSLDWLGVPLRSKQVVSGVIAIQTYGNSSVRVNERHANILSVLAPQVASAIERFFAEREIQKFKLGIDRSDNAVFITDLDGAIQYVNPAFEKVYGYTAGEAIGKTPRIIKSGLIPAEQYKNFWSTLTSGGTISGELVNRRKDGRLVPISGTNSPILDETGKIIGFLAVHQDITERKKSEETLKRRNDYLAASSEIGRLVTSTLDLNTIFTRTVNLISERFGFYFASIYIIEETGFKAVLREATGEAGEAMKAQRYAIAIGSASTVGKVSESGEYLLINDTAHDPLHQPNPLLLDTQSEVAIPLRIGSRTVGVIDIQSTETFAFTEDDISVLQSLADQVAVAIDNARSYELSQQLIKDLREVDQLKSQFLANMSHELRTPLNSIIGFSRVILKGIDGPVTDLQQQDLTAIYNSGQHLLGLINDILDLARIEAGKMELNFEEVHIAELTTSVLSTAKGLVKEKPIQLLQRIPSDMPTIRGDTMRVRQVLLNLISNASKFTDEGSITVQALTQKGPTGKMEALINVIDTGPGISLEDQEKLFKAFSQVDGSATRKTGGSGLGLSICANLIQLHGGRIGVTSEVGKGSTFWFTIPLYHQPLEKIPADKKIILAIDDDPQVIGLYERYLNPQGYYVVALTDPSQAKERILELKPFAVTLDIMMPHKDGWTVLTELKSDAATRDYPVIICSIIEQADKGFSLGAADYLVKPILEEDLVHALDRLNKTGKIRQVLVIDDDPNDLRLIEKVISESGRYKAILAEGGRKGWEALNTNAPDAIILDIFMPDMDGFTILEKLREDPLLRHIPVLVVSGGGLTNEQQKQLKEYGQRLITKGSLKEGELLSNIEASLKRISS